MDAKSLAEAIGAISAKIDENRDYLVRLDQQNGDGDLGISMSEGFRAVAALMEITEEADLGKLLMKAGNAFNESAPSSLGTILSFGFMGMARSLKGVREASPAQAVAALRAGVEKIMGKSGAKPGERTVLDALCPAVDAYADTVLDRGAERKAALRAAAAAAGAGAESTRDMMPVHGRAAYYGEKSLGHLDGGAVVGKLIFEALYEAEG